MLTDSPPRLSEFMDRSDSSDPSLLGERTTRRGFLSRASTLSLAIPGVGAALTACSPDSDGGGAPAQRGGSLSAADSLRLHNANSRLDTTLHQGGPLHGNTSATPGTAQGASQTVFHRYDPALPPRPAGGRIRLNWRAREVPVRIGGDIVVAGWTFEGDIPGPIVHCQVGDTVELP